VYMERYIGHNLILVKHGDCSRLTGVRLWSEINTLVAVVRH